jgi:hypothetical protein
LNVAAKPIVTRGPIECAPITPESPNNGIQCCQTETGKGGIEIRTCNICDDTSPPSNCSHRYQSEPGLSNPTGPKGGIDLGQIPQDPPKSNDDASSKNGLNSGQPLTDTKGDSSVSSINP